MSLLLLGCNTQKIAFTQDLRQQYRLDAKDLSRLQYYLSDDAELKRVGGASNHYIEDGELVTEKGDFIDSVVIEEDTPGIMVNQPKKFEIDISFEPETHFTFIAGGGDKYIFKRDRTDLIRYRQKQYSLSGSGEDGAHLEITKKSLEEVLERKKVLPGRELDD